MRDERHDDQNANPAAQVTDAVDQREPCGPRSGRKILGRPTIGDGDPQIESKEDEDRTDYTNVHPMPGESDDNASDEGKRRRNRQP